MKKILKVFLYLVVSVIVLIVLTGFIIILRTAVNARANYKAAIALAGPEVRMRTAEGLLYRDLNKNGSLDVYEDTRRPVEERVTDLLALMTLEEKAGSMFVPPVSMNPDGTVSERPSMHDLFSLLSGGTSVMIFKKHINHFNIFTGTTKKEMAMWYNHMQKLAERTRLGIPVTIASDPRNQYSSNPLTSGFNGDFSIWPEPLGLAAIGDSLVTAKFANIARQEYLAVGVRVALHPMADLSTEPRWPRNSGTFGEDAQLSAKLTYAYIKGFQGDSLGKWSVACMTKHFSGGGPQKEGIDPHLKNTKGQVYPGNNFDYHLVPFEAAFKAGTAEIMPYYGIPMDLTSENVGFSFNKDMITGLLRNKYQFDGVVCTDWGIITDTKLLGITVMGARARGMEKATAEERMLKVIEAGVDQFGGESVPEMLIQLVNDKKIAESRLDSSVRRILRVKFQLGLFDDPFVNVENAEETVGKEEFVNAGMEAQRKSIVLLKNDNIESGNILPLKKGLKIYIENMDPVKLVLYGTVVKKPEDADVAIIRLKAPGEHLKGSGILGWMFNSGDLDFKGKEKSRILKILHSMPAVVDVYLDRPAVMPEIALASKALTVNFGVSDEALLDVIFGNQKPYGRLPVELPSSMSAVKKQYEDVPYDSENPLFPFGFGITY